LGLIKTGIHALCPRLYKVREGYDRDEDENDLEDIPEAMASTPYLHKWLMHLYQEEEL
jgi:hypothetical protein